MQDRPFMRCIERRLDGGEGIGKRIKGTAMNHVHDPSHGHPLQEEGKPPAQHRFDTGQPGHGLLLFAIGIGKGKVDARTHRLALQHFVEQVSRGYAAASARYRMARRHLDR